MTTISIPIDDEMKHQLDTLCDELGMNITTFFMVYVKKALSERRIPFVVAPVNPFYTDKNIEQIKKAAQQIKNREFVEVSMEELEAMENE